MALKDTFQTVAETIFTVFASLVVKVRYDAIFKDGFDTDTTTSYNLDMIIDTFSERDVQFLSFSNLIQPTDVKGMIRGKQMRDGGLTILNTTDTVTDITAGITYNIIAYNTDPAKAVYVVLLRNV